MLVKRYKLLFSQFSYFLEMATNIQQTAECAIIKQKLIFIKSNPKLH